MNMVVGDYGAVVGLLSKENSLVFAAGTISWWVVLVVGSLV